MALAAVCLLVACTQGPRLEGDYSGTRPEVVAGPGDDPSVAVTMARVKLSLTGNGRFRLTEEGFTKEGEVLQQGGFETLQITQALGRPLESLGPEAASLGGTRKVRKMSDGSLLFERDGMPALKLVRDTETSQSSGP